MIFGFYNLNFLNDLFANIFLVKIHYLFKNVSLKSTTCVAFCLVLHLVFSELFATFSIQLVLLVSASLANGSSH